jgi:hypothetical protein
MAFDEDGVTVTTDTHERVSQDRLEWFWCAASHGSPRGLWQLDVGPIYNHGRFEHLFPEPFGHANQKLSKIRPPITVDYCKTHNPVTGVPWDKSPRKGAH